MSRLRRPIASSHASPQPIPYDELVSIAIEKGVDRVGWKNDLKKFLDEQVSSRGVGSEGNSMADPTAGHHVFH